MCLKQFDLAQLTAVRRESRLPTFRQMPMDRQKSDNQTGPAASIPNMVASTSPVASEAQRYQALFRVSQAISAQRDPKGLFCVLARELRNVIQFDGIGVAQYDEATKRVEWHVSERCSQPLAPEES